MKIQGHCHCGNVAFTILTEVPEPEVSPRACDCGFCRIHGAKNWSDPKGRVEIRVRDDTLLQRYRFALKTADFYLCRTCGAYVGAVISDGNEMWSTMNLRLTALRSLPATAASYGSETIEARIERRKRAWTPTEVIVAG